MDADFWHDKWNQQQIGFHQEGGNPMLVAHFGALHLVKGARVFVPLCGKTRDIAWLMRQGCDVVGAELSEIAVRDLFAEMDVTPQVDQLGDLKRYRADGVMIFVGNIFDVTADMIGPIDAVFDRAALVALPADMRGDYADHVMRATNAARQLLITFTYDQARMSGPPFSITDDMIAALYGQTYDVTALQTKDVQGGFKGQIPATETAWLLSA